MGVLQTAAAALVGAATGALVAQRLLLRSLKQLQDALQHEQQKRAADRQGRIRAEQALKQLRLEAVLTGQITPADNYPGQQGTAPDQATLPDHSTAETPMSTADGQQDGANSSKGVTQSSAATFPFTAIGRLKSCFNNRTGTPRQPHLVPAARAVLQLSPGVPAACLEGLQAYSHCWVLYVFHENTDLAKLLAARSCSHSGHGKGAGVHAAGVKSHIKVPRLDGAKMGVLATRSPHRPVPIGLSTAEVLEVDAAKGVLVLGGADIVDGSPVLDIKPYVPFCDALPAATAPDWVRVESDEEPLALGSVIISPQATAALTAAWQQVQRKSLYSSADQYITLVAQVLARDIRSLHQRKNISPVQGLKDPGRQQHQHQNQTGLQQGPDSCHSDASQQQGLQQGPSASGACNRIDNQTDRVKTERGKYSVMLDGVVVTYDVLVDTGEVIVRTAAV